MPEWVVLVAIAIVGWLVLALVSGILLGRLLGLAERRVLRGSRPQARLEAVPLLDERDDPA
jgi:hypothetical protein